MGGGFWRSVPHSVLDLTLTPTQEDPILSLTVLVLPLSQCSAVPMLPACHCKPLVTTCSASTFLASCQSDPGGQGWSGTQQVDSDQLTNYLDH